VKVRIEHLVQKKPDTRYHYESVAAWYHAELDEAQAVRLANELPRLPETTRIVVTMYPPGGGNQVPVYECIRS